MENGLTNATSQDTAWCPKHQIVKSVLSVRRHYPKRGRFTENLSIYLSTPAPNSPLQNPSNFGPTASHWPLYILLFFFFLILTGWMRGALCVATRLYILYLAADESISGWEFLLLIPKSPQFFSYFIFYKLPPKFFLPFPIIIFTVHISFHFTGFLSRFYTGDCCALDMNGNVP